MQYERSKTKHIYNVITTMTKILRMGSASGTIWKVCT